jgi:hypothetical protein
MSPQFLSVKKYLGPSNKSNLVYILVDAEIIRSVMLIVEITVLTKNKGNVLFKFISMSIPGLERFCFLTIALIDLLSIMV